MASVFFKRGTKSGLANVQLQDGAIYVTTDERAMYVDIPDPAVSGQLKRIRLGDFREYANFQTIAALSASALDTSALYYAQAENILCKWTGVTTGPNHGWIQINAQSTLAELAVDIYNSVTSITNGVQIHSGIRDGDYLETISGNIQLVSADSAKLAITGAAGQNGVPIITLTPEAIVYDFDTEITTVNGNPNLSFTFSKTGTTAGGSTVNDVDTINIPLRGDGVSVYESNGTLVIESDANIQSVTNAFSAAGVFTTTLIDGNSSQIVSNTVTPTIRYGQTTQDAVFASGVAILDVYTKNEVDTKINTELRAANAMTFKGSVGTASGSIGLALPTTNVKVGDTYKVSSTGNYGSQQNCNVGDMFIAMGTEDDTGVITSGLTWVYIPSGKDDGNNNASYFVLEYNSTTNTIDLVDGDLLVSASIVSGTDIEFDSFNGSPRINHAAVTRTNTTGQAQNQVSGHGAFSVNVITGITTSNTGHVTGVETTQINIADEYNAVKRVEFANSIAQSSGNAKVTLEVEDEIGTESGYFELHSDSLSFSASGSTTNIEMEWGSF